MTAGELRKFLRTAKQAGVIHLKIGDIEVTFGTEIHEGPKDASLKYGPVFSPALSAKSVSEQMKELLGNPTDAMPTDKEMLEYSVPFKIEDHQQTS